MKKNAMIAMIMGCLLFSACSQSAKTTNLVTITNPANNSVLTDNGSLSESGLFAFSVNGTASNIGENFICIYQTKPDINEWWRSGDPIGADNLDPNGKWTLHFATCGSLDNPDATTCQIKAVIQPQCPDSGSTVKSIGDTLGESETLTYRTK